jgi:hypothetical protein
VGLSKNHPNSGLYWWDLAKIAHILAKFWLILVGLSKNHPNSGLYWWDLAKITQILAYIGGT